MGGWWRKIHLRDVLRVLSGVQVGREHSESGGVVDLSKCDSVCHTQKFVEIDPYRNIVEP
jgi:hypothetical protein